METIGGGKRRVNGLVGMRTCARKKTRPILTNANLALTTRGNVGRKDFHVLIEHSGYSL